MIVADADRRTQAAAEYTDRLIEIEDVSAARAAVAAMHAIKQPQISEHVIAHLLCVVSATISRAGWSHTSEAEHVRQTLDDLSDLIKGA